VITHEILKPRPPTIVQEVRSRVLALVDHRRRQSAEENLHYNLGQKYMDKIPYTKWLEDTVRPKFPKGSLCTMRGLPYIPGTIPGAVLTVEELQEVCWMAPVDDNTNEPRCIVVRNTRINQGQITYPPALLRPLTQEENDLVHARDKAAQVLKESEERGTSPSAEHTRISNDNEGYSG
jgi:hypothetical protein